MKCNVELKSMPGQIGGTLERSNDFYRPQKRQADMSMSFINAYSRDVNPDSIT